MPGFLQILAEHSPLLVLDAASARVQVGWIVRGEPARWDASGEEAGCALFRCMEGVGAEPSRAAAFVFCEGPGSVLGVRTAAIAIRSWCALRPRPVFAFRSLALVAEVLALEGESVIADARRDSWHACVRGGPVSRVPSASLAGPLAMPEVSATGRLFLRMCAGCPTTSPPCWLRPARRRFSPR
jgi:tRNA threonylcarbamoyladenosine biosynthesis protein TsaB